MFGNCFPNTLDTTVDFNMVDGRPDTYIITGDIDAMWLRDSTNQVWPYVSLAKDDPAIRDLIRGLMRRQARCVLLDPYANAFYRTPDKVSQWKSDHTAMKPGVHERKYELDSLASVLRLAAGYHEATGDATPFDEQFRAAIRRIIQTIRDEQAGTPEQIHPHYNFQRNAASASDTLPLEGHGNPCRRTGMSRSPFRPSDDACVFQYSIPANAMAAINLQRISDVLSGSGLDADLAGDAQALGQQIQRAVHIHGIVPHPRYGPIFAYEVDGFGSCSMMDDAGPPSLLALPYLGFSTRTHNIYRNTRQYVLSAENPYFHAGAAGEGVGSPHIGLGWIWPLGIITRAMTAADDVEILNCLRTLKTTHAGKGFMHEAFWKDDASKYTRGWFAWANTYFGELIVHLARSRPDLLKRPLAYLETCLAGREFLVGSSFTVADLNAASIFMMAAGAKVDLAGYPQIRSWTERCFARPAFLRATAPRT